MHMRLPSLIWPMRKKALASKSKSPKAPANSKSPADQKIRPTSFDVQSDLSRCGTNDPQMPEPESVMLLLRRGRR